MTESMWLAAMTWTPPVSSPVAQGDPQAWLETAEELRPAVRSLIARLLRRGREHPDVEDCTHEAFRRALEGRARLKPEMPLRPWLLGIARHVAIDLLRTQRRRAPRELADGDSSAVEQLIDPAPGPDARLEDAERAQRVQQALDELDDAARRALLLFHVEGLAYREIAERLDVPLGTVCSWIARGRRSLAAVLQSEEPS